MKLLKSIIILIMTSSILAVDITAKGWESSNSKGVAIGIGTGTVIDLDDSKFSLVLDSTINHGLIRPVKLPNTEKEPFDERKLYGTGGFVPFVALCMAISSLMHPPPTVTYLEISAKLDYSFSERYSLTVGPYLRVPDSGTTEHQLCLGLKRRFDNGKSIELEIDSNAHVSLTARKTFD